MFTSGESAGGCGPRHESRAARHGHFSEVLKGRDPIVARAGADYLTRHGEFTVSVVSAMEIVYGLYRVDRTKQLEEFESPSIARITTSRLLLREYQINDFGVSRALSMNHAGEVDFYGMSNDLYVIERRGTHVGCAS